MTRGTAVALGCLTVFLVLFPLGIQKPGLPTGLKADEPSYYLMALSLAEDGDLLAEKKDLRRIFDEYPYRRADNMIVMTDDGWNTVWFGKPYLYSAFATPFAAAFGANGMVAFNMLLLMALVWMGTIYLARFNPSPVAAAFATGFFLLSSGFAYVFWLHPEVFNMWAIGTSLFFAFHDRGAAPPPWKRPAWRRAVAALLSKPALSGGAIVLAAYNKPMLGLLALPALFAVWQRRRWQGLVAWTTAALVVGLAVCGGSIALTGHPSAYLGVARAGVHVADAETLPWEKWIQPEPPEETEAKNSWGWIFQKPPVELSHVARMVPHFLFGRHTGLFVYHPFGALAILLFLFHERRSKERWVLLAGIAAVAFTFLYWIFFNWHGGGGFVGNRYFVNAYPALLFLATSLRPAMPVLIAGYAAAAALLGGIIFTPFGAPVRHGTLQAHVRGPAFRLFPLEWTIQRQIPGYDGARQSGAWFQYRKDHARQKGDEIQTFGSTPVEIWMQSHVPVNAARFRVRSEAVPNTIEIRMADAKQVLEFEPAPAAGDGRRPVQEIELRPSEPDEIRVNQGKKLYVYKLLVHSRTGRTRRPPGVAPDGFHQGAAITYLGPDEETPPAFAAEWERCELPETVPAREPFRVSASVRNAGAVLWISGARRRLLERHPVRASYHWLGTDGEEVVWDGVRTSLPGPVDSGETTDLEIEVRPPRDPGSYTLVVDLVREGAGWFESEMGTSPCRGSVTVTEPRNPAPSGDVDGSDGDSAPSSDTDTDGDS